MRRPASPWNEPVPSKRTSCGQYMVVGSAVATAEGGSPTAATAGGDAAAAKASRPSSVPSSVSLNLDPGSLAGLTGLLIDRMASPHPRAWLAAQAWRILPPPGIRCVKPPPGRWCGRMVVLRLHPEGVRNPAATAHGGRAGGRPEGFVASGVFSVAIRGAQLERIDPV